MRTCEPDAAVERARRLLRLSYLYAVVSSRDGPAGRGVLASLDVAAELDTLGPTEGVRAAFDPFLDGGR
jgi:hypothetical protein